MAVKKIFLLALVLCAFSGCVKNPVSGPAPGEGRGGGEDFIKQPVNLKHAINVGFPVRAGQTICQRLNCKKFEVSEMFLRVLLRNDHDVGEYDIWLSATDRRLYDTLNYNYNPVWLMDYLRKGYSVVIGDRMEHQGNKYVVVIKPGSYAGDFNYPVNGTVYGDIWKIVLTHTRKQEFDTK